VRLSAASTSSYRVQAIDRGRRSLLSPITAFDAPREFNAFPVRQSMFRKSGSRFSERDMRQLKESRAHPDSTKSGCALGKLDRDYRSCPRPLRFRQLMSCVTESALKFAPLGQRIVRTC
jgi:hypothetical protein